jgi:hypothetical protein
MSEVTDNPGIVFVDHAKYMQVLNPLFDEVVLDPTAGNAKAVLADVIRTPLGQRALDLTQLSKSKEHTTIPGTHNFDRLGHVIIVGEITDQIGRREGCSTDEILAYTLSATLSDLSHGPLSHATDIAVEGPGQEERFHELRSPEGLVLGGVMDVLKKRNIITDEYGTIPGVDIPRWVECSAPDVCVDRLQYTLQEMLLWFSDSKTPEAESIKNTLTEIASLKDIVINDKGDMVFTDIDQARLFAKGYLLLSTEHWNDPVNRVQLYLLIEALKYGIVQRRLPRMTEFDHGKTKQPFDYLYAVDSDILEAMRSQPGDTDPYLFAISNQLAGVGFEERGTFTNFKRPVFETFLCDDRAQDYPSALVNGDLADFGPTSSQFEIQIYEGKTDLTDSPSPQVPHLIEQNGNLHYLLMPLKNRYLDPLVRTEKGDVRLSDVDERYKGLLEQQQRIQQARLSVHIPTTTTYRELLWEQAEVTSKDFFKAQKELSPMSLDPKRRSIEAAAERALAAAIERGSYVKL